MQYQEISLQELILYFEGAASPDTRSEIESQRQNNPEFAEEYEEWESFLEEAESRESGIAKMKAFSQTWNMTELQAGPMAPSEKKTEAPVLDKVKPKTATTRPLFFRLAIAACVLLFAVYLWTRFTQGPSMVDQVNQQLVQEVNIMLSANAGVSDAQIMETYDASLHTWIQNKSYDQALQSLDSLLAQTPPVQKYTLLKGILLAQSGQNMQAIDHIKALQKTENLRPEDNCKIEFHLALLYAKTENKSAFDQSYHRLKTDQGQGFACMQLDSSIAPKLESLRNNF